jgi:hypothetical protein
LDSCYKVVFLFQQSQNENTMKLSNAAIERISERRILLLLALALDISEQWMRRVIEANKDNGPLTTAMALKVIAEQTGLKQEDILETEETIKEG